MSIKVDLSIKEIYKLLCKECKKKLKELVQRKITEQLADQILEK